MFKTVFSYFGKIINMFEHTDMITWKWSLLEAFFMMQIAHVKRLRKAITFLFLVVGLFYNASAQWGPSWESVKVIVGADHSDWIYNTGENVQFSISVFYHGNPVSAKEVHYQIMPEKMEPLIDTVGILEGGEILVQGGTMMEPGFLRCKAFFQMNGATYTGIATVAFEPGNIQPTTELPPDFDEFWDLAKQKAAMIPMDPKMELVPELCDEDVNTYQVSLQNFRPGSRIYGVLTVPKKEGIYPAILKVPGAGVWPHFMAVDQDAKKGVITFDIRIHGIPMISEEQSIYGDLYHSAVNEYWFYNLDDKDRYYYKRVYMGCVRAVDFIYSLDSFDGETLGVTGGSQGGALSIISAALDDRIKYLVSYYPALCDLTGYLYGRAGGWPHLFNKDNADFNVKPDKINTSKYYDVVNFARSIDIPGYYAWGFNDESCPPTSMYAAFNVIKAPKKLIVAQDAGHYSYPEQKAITDKWLHSQLSSRKNN
jgi:cephalosporin-C deacetylase-like acetyl esterase